MIALNHVLTGTAIGLASRQPLIVAPLAFLSHFVIDAVPHFDHYGFAKPGSKRFWVIWSIDAIACIGTLAFLCFSRPEYIAGILVGGVSAELPDALWAYYFMRKTPPKHWFFDFHNWIQWSESKLGIIPELIYLALIAYLNIALL